MVFYDDNCYDPDEWDDFCRLLRHTQARGITVKISPVPERDDATNYRGFVVIELCSPPTQPTEHSCYWTPACSPADAVQDALRYLEREG